MATASKSGVFIENYHKSLTPELERLRSECENAGIPVILKETEDILMILLMITKPRNILEIGAARAYSALFFASLLSDSFVTTIEKSDEMSKYAATNIDMSEFSERIELLKGDAEEILSEYKFDKKYDFVFIDAAKTHYREYFDLAEKLCNPGALIVCDNILINGWIYDRSLPGAKRHRTNVKYMRSFLDYLHSRNDLAVSLLSSGDGLAIIKLND